MFKVSVMYPNVDGARFDYDYYRTSHMNLVREHLGEFGLVKTEVEKEVSGGGEAPAPYIGIGTLYFDSADGYDRGIVRWGSVLRADIPNFTNVSPIRQISEILG